MAAGARFEPDSGAERSAFGMETPRIVIEKVMPVVSYGHKPAKAIVGQLFKVTSNVYCLTSGPLAVIVRWRHVDSCDGESQYMHTLGNRVWYGQILFAQPGPHVFCIDAWIDSYAGYCLTLEKAMQADTSPAELIDLGLAHIFRAYEHCDASRQQPLIELHQRLSLLPPPAQITLLMSETTKALMRDTQLRTCLTLSPEYPLYVVR
ncbi:maltotransferase domain-containing protein [Pseudomonas lundensis]|uniref:Alpha-1,4-glucan:maltose-1-phosphate maltosyltransferase domain-containing protein n=2 Tax=Pseudomonas TaxID=286 RepID=A0A266NAF4_9PSED|nr:hypothetical protein CJF39_10300 [Pseudomonas lundensis]